MVTKTVDVEASEEKSDGKVVFPFDDKGLLAFNAVSCFCALEFSLLVLACSLFRSLFCYFRFLTFSSRLSIFLESLLSFLSLVLRALLECFTSFLNSHFQPSKLLVHHQQSYFYQLKCSTSSNFLVCLFQHHWLSSVLHIFPL